MMKKLTKLLILCFLAAFVSCSDEETLNNDVDVATQELADDLSEYVDTSFGSFKGVFSTNDSQDRGVVAIEVINDQFAKATLTLVEREVVNEDSELSDYEMETSEFVNEKIESLIETVIEFQGIPTRTADGDLTVQLNSENASFVFVVAQDGSNPTINNAVFNDNPSVIKAIKENTRGAVITNSGLWAGTGTGGNAISGSFNLTFDSQMDADSNSTAITTMILFDGNDIGSAMGNEQSNCDEEAEQTCDISGVTGPASGITISWTGTHASLGAPGTEDCSQFNGTWSGPGGAEGTFISDAQCVAPANDLCEGAIAVACGDTLTTSNDIATNTDEPAPCAANTNIGLWYTYTGTADGNNITIDTFGSTLDTTLNVYTGACGALVCLGGNDDAGSAQSEFTFLEEVGTVYYIYLGAFGGTTTGTFAVNVTCAPPEPGDSISIAIPFTPLAEGTGCGTETQFNIGGGLFTDSGLDSSCQGTSTGVDIFYTWTADAEALLFTGGAGNPGVVVRDAATEAEIMGACFGTFGNGRLSGWTMGQDLIIQVYDFAGADVTVGFCLEADTIPLPAAGDVFATAITLTPSAAGTGCAADGFTIDFSDENNGTFSDSDVDSSCGGTIDIFYEVVTTTDGLLASSGNSNPTITAYSEAGVELSCIGAFGAGTLFGWEIGDTIIIQIADAANAVGFCLEEFMIPAPTTVACGTDTFVDPGGNPGPYDDIQTGFDITYQVDAGMGNTASIDFSVFDTENNWDYMRFYDGDSTSAPEITTSLAGAITSAANGNNGFTGATLQGDSIAATGQFLTIVFQSDTFDSGDEGWVATVNCQ